MRRLALVPLALLAARTALATTAADIPCDPSSLDPMPCLVTSTVAVAPGSTVDFGARALVVTASGEIDAGGSGLVTTISAASLLVQPGGRIIASGATLNLQTTGDLTIDANTTSQGRIDVSDSNGNGSVTITAGGNLVIAGQLFANASLTSAFGGSLDVTGTNVTVSGRMSATGGSTGGGGDICVTSLLGSTTISGTIDVSGGDGGTMEIDSDVDVTVTSTALLDGNAGGGGSADTIDIESFGGNATLAGTIRAHGPGDAILGGGAGADVCVGAVGTITNDASIDVSAGGSGALAGSIEFDTNGDITQRGSLNASATVSDGTGGFISLSTTLGTVDFSGNAVTAAGGASGSGGEIDAFSFNDVHVSNRLTADGPDALINLQGCAVSVLGGTARLSSVGTAGVNLLQASGQMTVSGTLNGDPTPRCRNDSTLTCVTDADCHVCQTNHMQLCTDSSQCVTGACDTTAICGSGNVFEFLDPSLPPIVTGAASVNPTAIQVMNPALIPCGGFPATTTTTSTTTTVTTATTSSTTQSTTTTTVSTTTIVTIPVTTTSTTQSTTTSTTHSTTTTAPTTTSTVPTTTTSTATVSTSTATTPSTTTTTLHVTCDPPDCDDGNACTDDTCDPDLGCVHTERTGFDAVTCALDGIVDVLRTAAVGDVGGPAVRNRFEAKLSTIRRMVDAGRTASGKKQKAKLRKANKLITAFVHTIQKGETQKKVNPNVGKQMTDLAGGAQSSLKPFIF